MTAAPARAPKVNQIGLEKTEYKGRESTLCNGCGHDSISAQIISVCYDLSINPTQVVKLSGIGCSSKTPAYFLNRSHGFNAVHGRMPSVATGFSYLGLGERITRRSPWRASRPAGATPALSRAR